MSQLPEFVKTQAVGCLCTSDEASMSSGAMVFYAIQHEKLYLITQDNSLKAQHISKNPNVCFVVADPMDYRQVQLYCTAKVVPNPGEYIPLLGEVIAKHSLKAHQTVSPVNIWAHGTHPVVIELTPQHEKNFRIGAVATERTTV
jgi:nitroimidazol reductase NimA-like FMN-containing flavoprotein (pyridoxamine 5'-phosphate oxidase superfamily)